MAPPAPWTLSVSQWTLREARPQRALERIATAGFAAVEIGGDIGDAAGLRCAVATTGLAVTSICPAYGPDCDFASDDPAVRRRATDLLRRSTDLAGDLGAPIVIVVPSDRPQPGADRPRADLYRRCADGIASAVADRPAGDRPAGDQATGPTIVIEALNRSETYLVSTLADADEMRMLVDRPGVALMADVYHLDLEEDDLYAALRRHGPEVRHVHLADRQRRPLGDGTLDFARVVRTLRAVGYGGALTFEFVPVTDASLVRARQHLEGLLSPSGGDTPVAA